MTFTNPEEPGTSAYPKHPEGAPERRPILILIIVEYLLIGALVFQWGLDTPKWRIEGNQS